MNKAKAIEKMNDGILMTHESFCSKEWVTMKNGRMVFEDDAILANPYEFWEYRTSERWNIGWSEYKN